MQFNPIKADTAIRLSPKTRELAAQYLRGEYKNRLQNADFSIADLNLPLDTDANVSLGKLSLLIAQKTPIIIGRQEKLAGCAPFMESLAADAAGKSQAKQLLCHTVTRLALKALVERESFCQAIGWCTASTQWALR